MLAGSERNQLEDEIENILGKDFLGSDFNSQSQTSSTLDKEYKVLLTALMNEQHAPELLQYKEELVAFMREKIDIQVF